MNKNVVTGIVLVGVLAVCGIGWLFLPALQDPRRAVEARASVQLERARRLLHRYDVGLAYTSLLIAQLGEQGIEVDPESVAETAADEYQQVHAQMWDAYRPTDWRGDTATPARASYGRLPDQIGDGLRGQGALHGENQALLDQAQHAIDEALAITDGNESSRSHAEANRLKGVILYHTGLAKQVRAQLHRREGDRYRRELVTLAAGAAELQSAKALMPGTNIDEQISRLEANVGEIDAALSEDHKALAALDASIHDLEARLTAAKSRRDDARKAMERLQAEGIDFSDPDGAETYRTRFEEQDRIYREAAREAHTLEYGTYPSARIDSSGDYLNGQYLENGSSADVAVQYGLLHYRNERVVLAAKIEGEQRALDDLRSGVTRLEGIRSGYRAAQTQAVQRVTEVAAAASELYTELNRVDSEAFAIEEPALDLLEKSARTSRQAATYADQWVAEARDRTRGLPPEAKGRSAHSARLGDDWMGGYVAAQVADARLAKAWIHYARYHACTQNAEILAAIARLGELQLNEADAESEQAKAKDAHDAGIEEVKLAMQVLERAHRKVERHWTVVAQAAGATYLLALFGHKDYAEDAIETYRSAVKGREDEEYARTFVARVKHLEKR